MNRLLLIFGGLIGMRFLYQSVSIDSFPTGTGAVALVLLIWIVLAKTCSTSSVEETEKFYEGF